MNSDLTRRSVMTRMAQSCLGVGLLPSMEHLFSSKAFAVGEGGAAAACEYSTQSWHDSCIDYFNLIKSSKSEASRRIRCA